MTSETIRRTQPLAAVIAAAILAAAVPVTAYGQAGGLPASPDDLTAIAPTEPSPTDAQKAAAFEKMMTWVEGNLGPQLGMKNPRQEWSAGKISLDNYGLWHFKLNQVFQGIHVVNGHLSIALQDAAGVGTPEAHGDYLNDPEVNTKPVISAQRALRIVRRMVRDEVGRNPRGKAVKNAPQQLRVKTPKMEDAFLEIHPGGGPGKRKLTYHTIVTDTSTAEPIQLHAWVGAQADNAGQVLQSYNNIQPQTVSCTGETKYQGFASYFICAFWPTGGVYVLNDNSLRIGAYDANSTCSTTYQAGSSSSVFGNFSLSDRNSTNADTLFATVQTMSFYYYVLGRLYVDNNNGPKVYQSVDSNGALLSARNHVCSNYNNAYWDGQKINIGDGDGSTFQSLASLDIIGHEWTHGVTQFTAGLNYSGESGALNESFSDIFGAMAERYWKGTRAVSSGCPSGVPDCGPTWQIGEEVWTPFIAGDALRYMYRPTLDGGSRDHYSLRYTGTADNGGVHINSGIQNNAFYLLANGGCHRFSGCMPFGIGADAATRIFYLALRDYLLPTDGFYWARRTTQIAASVIYGSGSSQYNATVAAWDLVGAP